MKKTEVVSKARARYIRISPRKARLVIDLIRGEKVNRALVILANLNKKARVSVEKVLKSAVHNARLNPALKTAELLVSKITADKGPMLKRYRAQAMGRATMIRHRTTHLTVELGKSEVRQVVRQVKRKKQKQQKKNIKNKRA